jgi:hypothetical protein
MQKVAPSAISFIVFQQFFLLLYHQIVVELVDFDLSFNLFVVLLTISYFGSIDTGSLQSLNLLDTEETPDVLFLITT